ncbi:MAG TPA: peptidylprolyl isomerase [Candidatus Acidoferrum sp.]|nr:peptidylprolyl isomerase [Candidatus Acidoferrum sp.]
MRIIVMAGLVLALSLGVAGAEQQEAAAGPAIENGSKVELEYTLTDDGGTVLNSNKGADPLTYTQGEQQIIPGLEKALNGMHAGEGKKVTIPPAEAYGEVNPAAVAEVPKDRIPSDALKVGEELVARSSSGESRTVRIKEIREKTVVIDLNHPLAGKTLTFDVKVVGVAPPSK